MGSALTAGYTNNVNILQVRTCGSSMQRLTDRTIDIDGNGSKERVTITFVSGGNPGTAAAPGGKLRETVSVPAGFNHTVVETTREPDGGIHLNNDLAQYTYGS